MAEPNCNFATFLDLTSRFAYLATTYSCLILGLALPHMSNPGPKTPSL